MSLARCIAREVCGREYSHARASREARSWEDPPADFVRNTTSSIRPLNERYGDYIAALSIAA